MKEKKIEDYVAEAFASLITKRIDLESFKKIIEPLKYYQIVDDDKFNKIKNKFKKVLIFSRGVYIKYGVYNLNEVLPFIGNNRKQYGMFSVNMASIRYVVFNESLKCVSCGIEGKYFQLEKHVTNTGPAHFNLYTIKDKVEILMTKDHIIPKVKGGTDKISNLQTMCSPCNTKKGHNLY